MEVFGRIILHIDKVVGFNHALAANAAPRRDPHLFIKRGWPRISFAETRTTLRPSLFSLNDHFQI